MDVQAPSNASSSLYLSYFVYFLTWFYFFIELMIRHSRSSLVLSEVDNVILGEVNNITILREINEYILDYPGIIGSDKNTLVKLKDSAGHNPAAVTTHCEHLPEAGLRKSGLDGVIELQEFFRRCSDVCMRSLSLHSSKD
jgi:hypothetical protein